MEDKPLVRSGILKPINNRSCYYAAICQNNILLKLNYNETEVFFGFLFVKTAVL